MNIIKNNEYIVGDSRETLRSLPDSFAQLIYFDPPYNTGRNFDDFNDKYESNKDFIDVLIKPVLLECHRILKLSGVIVIHIEPTISHYIRFAMDDVFGSNNFLNEIVWKSGGNKKSSKKMARFHDVIPVYTKTKKYIYNPLYLPYNDEYRNKNTIKICDQRGLEYTTSAAHCSQSNVVPRPNLRYEWNGHYKQWYVTKNEMQNRHDDNRLEYNKKGVPRFKKYLNEMEGIPIRDLWTDIPQIQNGEKIDYATQKPVRLLERIVTMFSNENDMVIDPFAGSGTTGRACINLNRQYLLIDKNPKGKELFNPPVSDLFSL